MEITITEQTDRPLLRREEITARIFFTGATPSTPQVADALAEELGCERELLLVKRVGTQFGDSSATVRAHRYADADSLERIEQDYVREKNVASAPEPTEDAPEEPEQPAAEEEAGATEEEPAADEEDASEPDEDEPEEDAAEEKSE